MNRLKATDKNPYASRALSVAGIFYGVGSPLSYVGVRLFRGVSLLEDSLPNRNIACPMAASQEDTSADP